MKKTHLKTFIQKPASQSLKIYPSEKKHFYIRSHIFLWHSCNPLLHRNTFSWPLALWAAPIRTWIRRSSKCSSSTSERSSWKFFALSREREFSSSSARRETRISSPLTSLLPASTPLLFMETGEARVILLTVLLLALKPLKHICLIDVAFISITSDFNTTSIHSFR